MLKLPPQRNCLACLTCSSNLWNVKTGQNKLGSQVNFLSLVFCIFRLAILPNKNLIYFLVWYLLNLGTIRANKLSEFGFERQHILWFVDSFTTFFFCYFSLFPNLRYISYMWGSYRSGWVVTQVKIVRTIFACTWRTDVGEYY